MVRGTFSWQIIGIVAFRFTAQGQFLAAVEIQGSGPSGIAVCRNKILIVMESCVQILKSDFTFFSTFGSIGSGRGQFKDPRDVACDSTGMVYVADTGNHRIQVFTVEGVFLREFGWHGQGRGELDWPNGIAIDASDMVYISEHGNGRVSVFTSEGQHVTSFGEHGKGPGEFVGMHRLAVDNFGVVYVCDCYSHRINAVLLFVIIL
jgi:tripartite motif-containing protein 2/3/tripartite motif-containing protein 71